MKKLKRLVILPLILALQTACVWKGAVKADAMAAPFLANDFTAIVSGCGNQPIVGYTYCRKAEGVPTSEDLVLHFPPVKCFPKDPATGEPRTGCISGKIFYPDGAPAYGFEVPFEATEHAVTWGTLTKSSFFAKDQRGFWAYAYEMLWVDVNNKEQKSFIQGEIRLRVYSNPTDGKAYVPLQDITEDPNFVWIWTKDGHTFKMTSTGRANVQ